MIAVNRLLKSCATPGGQLADRLDALRLAQLRLGLFALVDLRREPAVGGFEFGGALGDPPFEQRRWPRACRRYRPRCRARTRSRRRPGSAGCGCGASDRPRHAAACAPRRRIPFRSRRPRRAPDRPASRSSGGCSDERSAGVGPDRPADIVPHLLVVVLGDAVRPDHERDVGQRLDHQAAAAPRFAAAAPRRACARRCRDTRRRARHPAPDRRRAPTQRSPIAGARASRCSGHRRRQHPADRPGTARRSRSREAPRADAAREPRPASLSQNSSALRLANRMRWSRSIANTASPIASSTSASRLSEARTASLASRPTRAIARCSPTRDSNSRAPNGLAQIIVGAGFERLAPGAFVGFGRPA